MKRRAAMNAKHSLPPGLRERSVRAGFQRAARSGARKFRSRRATRYSAIARESCRLAPRLHKRKPQADLPSASKSNSIFTAEVGGFFLDEITVIQVIAQHSAVAHEITVPSLPRAFSIERRSPNDSRKGILTPNRSRASPAKTPRV